MHGKNGNLGDLGWLGGLLMFIEVDCWNEFEKRSRHFLPEKTTTLFLTLEVGSGNDPGEMFSHI